MFSVVGTVKSIRLLKDPSTGKFNGRAFVQMANAAEAKETITTLDGALLGNRLIEVCAARPKGELASSRPLASKPKNSRKNLKGRKGKP